SSIDIAPTLLELAGAETGPSVQGKSFAQLLERPEAGFRTYVFGEHNWHDYQALERSVRTKDLLYIRNLRPALDNAGAIDVNQGPSAGALRKLRDAGSLSPLQANFFTVPRPAEELYDCAKDPFQERNLAGDPAYRGELVRLRNVMDRWREETGDSSPAQLTPDWYDRETGKPLPEKGRRGEMPGAAKRADTINVKGPF
ncbi:MAG TPA: heparan N-sulfatase, partial [Anseongella sp.]|nr:heparan N-sulfatase [Anseongella sp.]